MNAVKFEVKSNACKKFRKQNNQINVGTVMIVLSLNKFWDKPKNINISVWFGYIILNQKGFIKLNNLSLAFY